MQLTVQKIVSTPAGFLLYGEDPNFSVTAPITFKVAPGDTIDYQQDAEFSGYAFEQLSQEEKEKAIDAAGYYLRDDSELRKDWGGDWPVEAYSFCHKNPFWRVAVYAGTKSWAVNTAYHQLMEGIEQK